MALDCLNAAAAHQPAQAIACIPFGMMGDAFHSSNSLARSGAVCVPGSPQQVAEGQRGYDGSAFCRMEADVKLLSGSKRSCEGYTSLQDEADADDTSMMSGRGSLLMCRSSSFGIKRVCSIASADAIDSYCPAQQQPSIMIPVPGSNNNLQHAASAAAAAASPALGGAATLPAAICIKRSSKTGSRFSSQELGAPAAGAAAAAAAGQEAASGSGLRRLAPIKTSSVPRGPRLRLNGRLLSPEEAQKHLQAVAVAAAAASAGRSLSRAPSPSPATTGACGNRASPARPHCSSASLSTGGAPCSSAGHSSGSGMCSQSSLQQPAAGKPPGGQHTSSRVLSALDVLPENFIPTPEGVGTWHTLASTLEEGCGATSRGCGSPLVCSSYTELLLAEEGDSTAAAAVATAPVLPASAQNGASFTAARPVGGISAGCATGALGAGGEGPLSAFAGRSVEPWPIQQQQQQLVGGPLVLAPAGSMSALQTPLSSSCPVHIPMHRGSNSSSWTSSKLLSGSSLSGSNGSSGSGNTSLEASLVPQDSTVITDSEISELLDWAAPLSNQTMQQQQSAVVSFTGLGSSSSGSVGGSSALGGWAGPAASSAAAPSSRPAATNGWKPAFASVAAGSASTGGAASTASMVPTPGVGASGGTGPGLAMLPQQQQRAQLHRTKSAFSRTKKASKASGSAKPAAVQLAPGVQVPPGAASLPDALQQQQRMLLVADGGQQVVLSQQELMAIVQQNMAASFASGYMMASSMQTSSGQQGPAPPPQLHLQQQQQQLLKPVASVGAFVMPASAAPPRGMAAAPPVGSVADELGLSAGCGPVPGNANLDTAASAAAALGSSGDAARLVGGNGVDDILPSLQELLTDCY